MRGFEAFLSALGYQLSARGPEHGVSAVSDVGWELGSSGSASSFQLLVRDALPRSRRNVERGTRNPEPVLPHFHPVQRPLDGLLPSRDTSTRAGRRTMRLPLAIGLPVLAQLLQIFPEAGRQAGGVRGAERGRLRRRPGGRRGRPAMSACSCISVSLTVAPPSTFSTSSRTPESSTIASSTARVWKQMASSVARARCARVWKRDRPTIAPRASERQYGAKRPENAGTKYAPPVSATRERQRLDVGGGLDDAELIAQPLHGRAGHRDRSFERVDRLAGAELVAHRRQQPGLRRDDLRAGVQQHEVAGAVGVLGLAGIGADLAEQSRPAGRRARRRPALRRRPARCVASCRNGCAIGRRADRRQHHARHARRSRAARRPNRARRRSISIVRLALVTSVTCAPPSMPPVRFQIDPAVDRAEHRFAARGRRAHAVDVLEDPLQLGARKIGRRRKAGALANQLPGRAAIQRADDAVGARVLPDDRVVPGLTGLRIPDDRRLALVGDADGGEVGADRPPCRSAPAITVLVRSAISSGSCSTQPGWVMICWCSS